MSEQKGYYREAVDIKFIPGGTQVRLADDAIVTTPRSGMYKVNTGLLLVEVMQDVKPAISEAEAEEMVQHDPRGATIVQGPWGKTDGKHRDPNGRGDLDDSA